MPCLTCYYSCAKVTKNYLEILLALKFQEDYSTEQHHCIENYYGDNWCLVVESLIYLQNLQKCMKWYWIEQ